ncbi:MAG: hypothetical protein Cons2KO_22010 [Congregibacter sp.]
MALFEPVTPLLEHVTLSFSYDFGKTATGYYLSLFMGKQRASQAVSVKPLV